LVIVVIAAVLLRPDWFAPFPPFAPQNDEIKPIRFFNLTFLVRELWWARRHRRREQQQRVAAAAASQLSSADADEL
jgi:hypothetical protein